jgi:hypothetical protein
MHYCSRCFSFFSLKPIFGGWIFSCLCPPPITYTSDGTGYLVVAAQSEDASRKKGE